MGEWAKKGHGHVTDDVLRYVRFLEIVTKKTNKTHPNTTLCLFHVFHNIKFCFGMRTSKTTGSRKFLCVHNKQSCMQTLLRYGKFEYVVLFDL